MQKTTTSRLLNRGGIADLPLLRTLLTIRQKVPRAKFLESDGLFCVISICKFGSFRNPFAMVTSLSELYFRFRRFILLVQTKKVISMNYGSRTSSWKPWRWVMHDVIFSMTNIYINSNLNPLTKFTSSNICKYISTEFKDILSWNISQMITKTVPITTRSHKLCDEIGHPIANLMESQWKLRQQHDHNFQMEGKSL